MGYGVLGMVGGAVVSPPAPPASPAPPALLMCLANSEI